jgi:hypothetical protein
MLTSKLFIVLLSAISALTIAFMPKTDADKTPQPTVMGMVTDATGSGLIGASIVVKGTKTGTRQKG